MEELDVNGGDTEWERLRDRSPELASSILRVEEDASRKRKSASRRRRLGLSGEKQDAEAVRLRRVAYLAMHPDYSGPEEIVG